jgi:hypothetical protein
MHAVLKGYRTVIFNVIMAGLLVVRGVFPEAELPDEAAVNTLIDGILGSIEAITIIGNLILRAFTTTPIGQKVPE